MSKGKYSPTLTREMIASGNYTFNCYGNVPSEWNTEYDERVHFGNYDSDGFDSYGYSAFDSNGEYVGICSGIDRNGYTEFEYMQMTDEEFESL